MPSFLTNLQLALLLLCVASNVPAQDSWPQFRGPNASGIVNSGAPLPAKLSSETLKWKVLIPHGVSSPCIWGDRVFLTGHDVDQKQLITLCMEVSSGKELWSKRTTLDSIPGTHVANSPAAPTIATDGERIYVYFGLIGLTCYGIDGEEVWTKPLPTPKNQHGAGSSPTILGERLFIVCDQGELFRSIGSYLLCLDKRTGKEIWRKNRPLSGPGWTTPVFWAEEDKLIVLGRRLIAYDLNDGAERWWVDGMMDFALTTPTIGDGLLFAVTAAGGFEADLRIRLPTFANTLEKHDANKDGKLEQDELPAEMVFYQGDTTGLPGDGVTAREGFAMFDGDKDGFVVAAEWDGAVGFWNQMKNTMVAIRPGGDGDVTKSHVVWRADRNLPEVPSPLYYQGRVYLVKNGGIVSCLDANTGALIYRRRLGAVGNYFGSPIAGDEKIYAVADTGVVTCFLAGDEFKVLSRNELGEQLIATPAISNGKIFVRSAKHLWSFGSER